RLPTPFHEAGQGGGTGGQVAETVPSQFTRLWAAVPSSTKGCSSPGEPAGRVEPRFRRTAEGRTTFTRAEPGDAPAQSPAGGFPPRGGSTGAGGPRGEPAAGRDTNRLPGRRVAGSGRRPGRGEDEGMAAPPEDRDDPPAYSASQGRDPPDASSRSAIRS